MDQNNIISNETDKNGVEPLSDEQLERAAGGSNSPIVSRWKCLICGEQGHWYDSDYTNHIEAEKGMHSKNTGHEIFGIIFRLANDPFED